MPRKIYAYEGKFYQGYNKEQVARRLNLSRTQKNLARIVRVWAKGGKKNTVKKVGQKIIAGGEI